VLSRDGVAVDVLRGENEFKSPYRYSLDPKTLFAVFERTEEEDLDLGLIYHSHTRSDPVPSETDVNLARLQGEPRFPGTLYLIVGVKGEQDDVRVWSIVGDAVEQRELQVDE
jgi:proteasome lid subunit RPN8/RPN11